MAACDAATIRPAASAASAAPSWHTKISRWPLVFIIAPVPADETLSRIEVSAKSALPNRLSLYTLIARSSTSGAHQSRPLASHGSNRRRRGVVQGAQDAQSVFICRRSGWTVGECVHPQPRFAAGGVDSLSVPVCDGGGIVHFGGGLGSAALFPGSIPARSRRTILPREQSPPSRRKFTAASPLKSPGPWRRRSSSFCSRW